MGNFFNSSTANNSLCDSIVLNSSSSLQISKSFLKKILLAFSLLSSYYLLCPLTKLLASYLETQLMKKKNARRPKRLILIRHGQSIGNIDDKIYSLCPDNQLSLSELGKSQAFEAGSKLKEMLPVNDRIKFFVSPFLRTKQTFNEIAKHFDSNLYTYIEDPRLREQEWGNYQETSQLQNIRQERKKVGKFYYRFPTGESGADVYDRASLFLTSLYREIDALSISKQKSQNDTIIIVTHGLFIRLFLMRYFKWTVEEFDKIENPGNCEIILLEKNMYGKYELTKELRKKQQN
jgi:broad specificity phosphatase PhoE